MKRATGIGLLSVLMGVCLTAGSGCSITRLQGELNAERARSQQLLKDRFDLERDLNVAKGVEQTLKDRVTELTVRVQTLRGQVKRAAVDAVDVIPVVGPEDSAIAAAVTPAQRGPTGFEQLTESGVHARWAEDGTLRVTLPDGLFGAGQASLSRKGRALVDSVCGRLQDAYSGHQVVVEGHTDNTPVSKVKERFPSNWELSSARAGAVLRALVAAGKASPGESYVVGFGPNKPIASNESKAGRRANRRVELLVRP